MLWLGLALVCPGFAAAGNLLVTVSDQNLGPIEGAKVYAYSESGAYTGYSGLTDADGIADLGAMDQYAAGTYQFKAKYLASETWSGPVALPGQGQAAVVIDTAAVSVTVRYAGQTAADCKVYLFSESGSCLSQSAVTDESGRVVFNLPVGGVYKFRAGLLGQYYFSPVLSVAAGDNAAVIDAGGGHLTVRVQKQDAAPLADIHLKLYSPAGCYLGQSASSLGDGSAVFSVSAGTYRIRADCLGHRFWSADTVVDSDSEALVTIAHNDVTISVEGLFAGTSTAIEEARVQLYTDTEGWVGLKDYTDAAGQVTFNLPVKGYKAAVTYLGQTYWSGIFSGADAAVAVPMAQADVAVTWNGVPLENVPVHLFTATGGWTGVKQVTGAAGKALFALPAGTWQFRADYQSNQYWSKDNALSADVTSTVELSTGGGTLLLTIAKDDGAPLTGVNCTVYTESGAWTGVKGATNSQGLVNLNLAQGSFKIRMDYLGHQFWSEVYNVTAAMADTLQIPHKDVRISVNGVFDTTRTPFEYVIVKLYTGSGHWTPLYEVTDAGGQALFSLPEKPYQVRVDYMGGTYWSQPFTWQDSAVDIALADVQVAVSGAAGMIEGAKVLAYTEADKYTGRKGYTDAAGRISFRLPVGRYKFKAQYLGHQFESDVIEPAAGQQSDIEIATGGGNFTLTVLKDAQNPIAGAKCYLYTSDSTRYLGLWAYSDENGQAAFDLVDGSYSFKVAYLGYTYFTPAVQVPQSLDQSLTIAHSDLTLTINAVGDTSVPIEGAKVYLYTAAGGWLGQNRVSDAAGQVSYALPAQDYKVKVYYLGHYFWSDPFNSQNATVNIPTAQAKVSVSGAGAQLEGVKVYAYTDAGGWLGLSGATGIDGAVDFSLPVGQFKFAAYYQGKKFYSNAVELAAGDRQQVAIDTGGGIFELTVQKDPYHRLENVKCYVYTDTGACVGMSGTTDARGAVTFALSEGGYKFKVYYQGYYYLSDVIAVPEKLAHDFTLAHLRYPIFVQGINPGPAPLANIKVYAYTEEGRCTGLSGVTDAGGRIDFDLAPGSFKAKYYYNGQYYFSGILQPQGTLISIDQNGGAALLDAVTDPAAAVTADNRIELSWGAANDAAGYIVYRRAVCEPEFVQLNTEPIAATAYTDSAVAAPGSYTYYIVAVSADNVAGRPSAIVSAQLDGDTSLSNTVAVADLAASWNQGTASLNWSAVAGCTYQVFRGARADALTPYQRCDTPPFQDAQADTGRTWYYQVASVISACDPLSGQQVEAIGPLSALVTLGAVTPPVAAGDSMPINGQGDYIITTGAGGAYSFQGSYSGFDGPVTVTAQLGDQVVTGSASGGSFSIDLPSAGNWQITLTDANGWQSVVIDTVWQIDDQPPVLTVDGPAERSTGDSLVDISGSAHDSQSAVQAVTIASDRYPDTGFGAALGGLGHFTGQAPLKPGENILTITAVDIHANSSVKTISVTQTLSALPAIQITSPADGQTVTSRRIDVSGTVRSSLAAEKIRLVLNDQVIFPEGSDNLYSFTFHEVPLAAGSNRLTVRAETAYGNVEAQATVNCGSADPAQKQKPRIEVLAPLPDTYLAAAPVVSGLVRSELGVKAVSVNGQPAAATGLGSTYVSFKAIPNLGAAADPVITIVATDLADQTSTVTFSVHLDTTAPLIVLQDTNLAPPPAVNTAAASPYVIAGTIGEAHLAGAAINDQPIALSPAGPADTYSFSAGLPLTYGMDQPVTIAAWDLAGNRTGTDWIVRLDSDLVIEVIDPPDGAKLQATGEQTAVAVTVRVAGAQADDVFWAAVDNGAAQSLTRSGAVGNAVFNVSSVQAGHSLAVWVQNSAGARLGSTTTEFSLRNMDDVPLSVQQIKPANGAAGIEPNDFIAIYFNKSIDPAQLSLEVLETAHGQTYAALESGADITQLTQVALIEVNREREPVPGGIAHFPVNRMVAFYPARDLAYGASVYVTATYAGQEVARAVFSVRPLPTFVEGTVQDGLRMGLAGIQVAIPELGLATTTDRDGGFGFGFKSSAAHTIAAGRYKVVANAQMADKNYGIGEQWVNVTAGRLNSMDVMLLAGLNPSIAFRRIVSGHAQTVLADGALVLDLSQAQLTFGDLRDQGDVHVQLLNLDQIGHKPLASLAPYWMFAIQPAGIQVAGKVGLTIAVPTCNGTHAYVQSRGKYYILLGLDPVSLMIVPVGLAEFDYENRQMKSLQPAALQRLDYIGFAVAPAEAYPFIEQCALGEISFDQMVSGIENLR